MGLSQADCNLLRNIWTKMRDRRMARRRRGQGAAAAGITP